MAVKKWYMSKTLWVNAAALVAAVGLVAQGQATWQTALAPVGMAIANMVLRIVTRLPLD